jgi:hypothetical protein
MGHRTKAVVARIGKAGRVIGIAVAAQISANHGAMLCQNRRNSAPHRLGLRKAVEQQNRRARVLLASNHTGNTDTLNINDTIFKICEHDFILPVGWMTNTDDA